MNLVNLSTAIHRVAKIVGSDPWLQATFGCGKRARCNFLLGGFRKCGLKKWSTIIRDTRLDPT